MSGSATVTVQLGSSSFSASVRARAAARWPPPVSLNRMRIRGDPPAGVGYCGAGVLLASRSGPAGDPSHVVGGQQIGDEAHGDDGDADPQDRSLGQLARRERAAAWRVVGLDDVGRDVLDVLLCQLGM